MNERMMGRLMKMDDDKTYLRGGAGKIGYKNTHKKK